MINAPLEILSIMMQNFRSYGRAETVIDLTNPGAWIIKGSNGVGKTTTLEALCYALYGQTFKKDTKIDELINDINKKDMRVEVRLRVGTTIYRVVRGRKTGKGSRENIVLLYETIDGVETQVDETAGELDIRIQDKIVCMSFAVFCRILIYTASTESFFKLPTTSTTGPSQTSVLEELFNLGIISERASAMKKQMKDWVRDLDIKKEQVKGVEAANKRYNDQMATIDDTIAEWDADRLEKIADLETKLGQWSDYDFDAQLEILDAAAEIETESSHLKSRIDTMMRDWNRIDRDVTSLEAELETLKTAKCPYCAQEFADSKTKLKERVKVMQELLNKSAQLDESIEKDKGLRATSLAELEMLKGKIEFDSVKALNMQRATLATLSERIRAQRDAVNPYHDVKNKLAAFIPEEIDYTEVNALQTKVDHANFLYKMLTRPDSFIRKRLIEDNIPLLNQRLDHHLRTLELPHRVVFNNAMTADISLFDRVKTYSGLSTGQQARVNIALSSAFRDVLEHLHRPINIWMLDEALDYGLDSEGITCAARLTKQKARESNCTVFVITHREEISTSFDKSITVTMVDQFSNLEVRG